MRAGAHGGTCALPKDKVNMVKCEQLVNLGEDYQRVLLLLLQLSLKYEMISKSKGNILKSTMESFHNAQSLGWRTKRKKIPNDRI